MKSDNICGGHALLTLVGFCLAATAGKLRGIGVARVRLSRQIRSVENLIAVATREKEDEK